MLFEHIELKNIQVGKLIKNNYCYNTHIHYIISLHTLSYMQTVNNTETVRDKAVNFGVKIFTEKARLVVKIFSLLWCYMENHQ
jgi:hypothetical protein